MNIRILINFLLVVSLAVINIDGSDNRKKRRAADDSNLDYKRIKLDPNFLTELAKVKTIADKNKEDKVKVQTQNSLQNDLLAKEKNGREKLAIKLENEKNIIGITQFPEVLQNLIKKYLYGTCEPWLNLKRPELPYFTFYINLIFFSDDQIIFGINKHLMRANLFTKTLCKTEFVNYLSTAPAENLDDSAERLAYISSEYADPHEVSAKLKDNCLYYFDDLVEENLDENGLIIFHSHIYLIYVCMEFLKIWEIEQLTDEDEDKLSRIKNCVKNISFDELDKNYFKVVDKGGEHFNRITSLSVSPCGQFLAVAASIEEERLKTKYCCILIKIPECTKHKIIYEDYGYENKIGVVAFSPDNKYIAIGGAFLSVLKKIDKWLE